MEILKIVLICIIAVLLILLISNTNKEQAVFIRIITSVLLIFILSNKMIEIYEDFKIIFDSDVIGINYFKIIIKVIVIAYLSEFASDISKDAGENTIASNAIIAGKILIIYISSPIFIEVIKKMTMFIN